MALIFKVGIVVMGVCLRRFCLNMNVVGTFVCSEWGQGTTDCLSECCFGVMYGEWYGVCEFVVEVWVDYGGVNAFHVCLDFSVVYRVGVCVNVYGVVCIVVCCLFLPSGCCLLYCDVVCCSGCVGCCEFCLICDSCSWRCSFMGSCVFRRIYVVCWCWCLL